MWVFAGFISGVSLARLAYCWGGNGTLYKVLAFRLESKGGKVFLGGGMSPGTRLCLFPGSVVPVGALVTSCKGLGTGKPDYGIVMVSCSEFGTGMSCMTSCSCPL